MNTSRIKRVPAIHKVGFTVQPPMGLEEYRERHPRSASIPTLTQQGMIGFLLERSRRKAARRETRRAIRQRVIRALLHPFAVLWRPGNGSNPARSDGALPHGAVSI